MKDRTSKIQLILGVLQLICLFDMPYGFYQFIRLASLIGFGVLALTAFNEKKENIAFIYLGLAILFQPFYKIVLTKSIWNIVNGIVGAWLLYSAFKKKK